MDAHGNSVIVPPLQAEWNIVIEIRNCVLYNQSHDVTPTLIALILITHDSEGNV